MSLSIIITFLLLLEYLELFSSNFFNRSKSFTGTSCFFIFLLSGSNLFDELDGLFCYLLIFGISRVSLLLIFLSDVTIFLFKVV